MGERKKRNVIRKQKFVEKINWKEFGKKVRSLMKFSGVDIDVLANDMQIQKRSLINTLNGFSRPSLDLLIGLAEYFNVSIDYLLGRTSLPFNELIDKESTDFPEIDGSVLFLAQQFLLLKEQERNALAVLLGAILGVGERVLSMPEHVDHEEEPKTGETGDTKTGCET